jgi:hypothetical protein
MNLQETEWDAMEWTHLPKDSYKWRADMNMIINRRVPQNMDFMKLRVAFRVFVTEPNGYFNAVTSQESAWLRSEQSDVWLRTRTALATIHDTEVLSKRYLQERIKWTILSRSGVAL